MRQMTTVMDDVVKDELACRCFENMETVDGALLGECAALGRSLQDLLATTGAKQQHKLIQVASNLFFTCKEAKTSGSAGNSPTRPSPSYS